jgi:hypothetical protein
MCDALRASEEYLRLNSLSVIKQMSTLAPAAANDRWTDFGLLTCVC